MNTNKVVIVLACIAATAIAKDCACTFDLRPVCGSNGRTYDNLCELRCAATEDRSIVLSRNGPCEIARDCACTFDLRPVCGSNGRTYDNLCELRCAASDDRSIILSRTGPCEIDERLDAFCPCPKILDPVCTNNNVTYNNVCMFKCDAQRDSKMKIMYHGECTAAKSAKHNIPCRCNRMYEPVCGSDSVTYDNQCMLECAAIETKNYDLKMVKTGKCVSTLMAPCRCNRMYQPVCGSDSVTYDNRCVLECAAVETRNHNLKVVSNGKCGSTLMAPCMCTRIYAPVCGSDYKTYDNKCMLVCAAVSAKKDLMILKNGEC